LAIREQQNWSLGFEADRLWASEGLTFGEPRMIIWQSRWAERNLRCSDDDGHKWKCGRNVRGRKEIPWSASGYHRWKDKGFNWGGGLEKDKWDGRIVDFRLDGWIWAVDNGDHIGGMLGDALEELIEEFRRGDDAVLKEKEGWRIEHEERGRRRACKEGRGQQETEKVAC
jgi:hypothetical protein